MSSQGPNVHADRLRLALHALNTVQARLDAVELDAREPIAIVGVACRFPGADDVDAFWRLLRDGVDAVGETPADRWSDDLYDPDPETPGRMYTRAGAYVAGIDRFDAQFFGIAPREAVKMDPQHRWLLEVTWEALERSGIAPDRLSGSRTGVFVGITTSDYESLLNRAGVEAIDAYHMTGSCLNFAAGRIAYTLGLHGPTLAVDTACSSSLVAVHLACQSLRLGESTMAIAAGVNAILSPERTITACKAKMLSTFGRARTFDAGADGFVRGEGCGVVVLKRLRDAIADGDRVLALIRGSAVNQDGPSSGLTVPNKLAQESVIRQALDRAGVAPADVGYVEAHGTGTSLGDPIEMRALAAVLSEGRDPARPLRVASVKTNIGHLESAAGIAGLIKTVLTLQHKQIPPHLHLRVPSPHIDWSRIPVEIPRTLTPWTSEGQPRLAAVSSFGGSGTNAHIVLEEAPMAAPAADAVADRPVHVLCVSGRTEAALRQAAAQFADALADTAASPIADFCFTANSGRAHFAHRLAVSGATREDLAGAITRWREGGTSDDSAAGVVRPGSAPRIGFLFTGQGSQRVGMGRELYATSPTFKRHLDECVDAMQPHLDAPLRDVIFDDAAAARLLNRTEYTQPALFAIEYALGRLWMSWGIQPSVMLGHSVGEYVAACLAGVFSVADAARLITARARLMGALPEGGGMAAVFADAATVQKHLPAEIEIAAFNAPDNIVVSGRLEALAAFLDVLRRHDVKAQQLTVSHAFHSALIAPALAAFESVAATVAYARPSVPVMSNLTGKLAANDDLITPRYWSEHARRAVRFEDGIRAAAALATAFVEVGPNPTLIELARRRPEFEALCLPSLRRARGEWQQMLRSLAALYAAGSAVDWRAFDADYRRAKVPAPTYPFQRERYWIETPRPSAEHAAGGVATGHPLLGRRLRMATADSVFEAQIDQDHPSFLADHRVFGTVVVPATCFIELMAAAAGASPDVVLEDVVINEALALGDARGRTLQVIVGPAPGRTVRCCALEEDAFVVHAEARIGAAGAPAPGQATLDELRARHQESVPIGAMYDELAEAGIGLGPAFRTVRQLWKHADEALGLVELPESLAAGTDAFVIHPVLLDGCLQVASALLESKGGDGRVFVPVSAGRVRLGATRLLRAWSHVVSRPSERGMVRVDITVYDDAGHVVAAIDDARFRQATRDAMAGLDTSRCLYEIDWSPTPLPATRDVAAAIDCSPDDVITAVELQAASAIPGDVLSIYAELLPQIDALCAAWVARALAGVGADFTPGARLSVAGALSHGVQARHARFVERLLEMLEEDGVLMRTGAAEWEVVRVPPIGDAAAFQRSLEGRYPQATAELDAIGRIGPELGDALTGRRDTIELLFPNGSLSLTERLYRDSPLLATHNTFVRDAIARIVQSVGSGTKLRVLEIGGGTGGATSQVLPVLPADRVEYTFTDVSPMFLTAAREKFARHGFVTYRTLDIEQDPSRQGFGDAAFDVVIAANVLHATAALRQTVSHVMRLLAPGGALVLLEATEPQRYGDLIVGLTDGWWKFTDTDLRVKHALIQPQRWADLLGDAGCETVACLDEAVLPGMLRHQSVIVGKKSRATAGGARASQRWLVFADGDGIGQRVAERLAAAGASCTVVPVEGPAPAAPDRAATVDRARRAVASALEAGPLHGVVCSAVDVQLEDAATVEDVSAHEARTCGPVLGAVQAIVAAAASPRLWLLTRGAQPVTGREGQVAAVQASLWGLGRTIALEHPELRSVRIDLDPAFSADASDLVDAELRADGSEPDVAYREGVRHVAALRHATVAASRDRSASDGLRVQIDTPGVIEHLGTAPAARVAPAAGFVEIQVAASGLTFRDVLKTLGMYPGDDGPLGDECAGRVVRVAPDVTSVRPGDRVVAIAPGSMSSWVTADARFVARKPDRITFEQAASIPSVFLTARYGLEQLARLQRGERVLIHAAAGGVGLAAVQIALRLGAEVFATAGSAAKREFLSNLGVQHVMDSRSASFAEQIRQATVNRGVDVILSSLTGEFVPLNLSVLAEGGRYVEIGRRGIWEPKQVAAVRPDAVYFVLDLADMFTRQPDAISKILADLMADFASGALEPLPVQSFPFDEAVEAFRRMAQAKHIGKIVLTPPAASAMNVVDGIAADASYLITGGLNGLGLEVARWIVDLGARHLVLMGRRAPDAAAQSAIAALESEGARVTVCRGDVSRSEDVSRAVAEAVSLAPLRGVIHSAGVLDDAVLEQQEWSRFETVMAPKVRGAWNLHRATTGLPLDFFVLFSSAVATLGSSAQGNHAAACAFLDALASYRIRSGRPGASIGWGPWSDIGSVARQKVGDRLKAHGLHPFRPEDGLRVFEAALRAGKPHVVAVSADWSTYVRQTRGGRDVPRFLSSLVTIPTASAAAAPAAAAGDGDLRALLAEAAPADKRKRLLSHVRDHVLRVVGLDPSFALDPQQGLRDLGIDSLMGVELRNRLQASVGRPLPSTLVFDYPTLAALVDFLATQISGMESEAVVAEDAAAGDRAAAIADLDRLSAEEAEALLLEELSPRSATTRIGM